MRFFPRNRQSRHDALIGPNHVAGHPRADELTRRDRNHRYERGNDLSFVLTGTVGAVDQATFQAGGTLIFTCAGDDRFKFDAVTVRSAALIAAFAALVARLRGAPRAHNQHAFHALAPIGRGFGQRIDEARAISVECREKAISLPSEHVGNLRVAYVCCRGRRLLVRHRDIGAGETERLERADCGDSALSLKRHGDVNRVKAMIGDPRIVHQRR